MKASELRIGNLLMQESLGAVEVSLITKDSFDIIAHGKEWVKVECEGLPLDAKIFRYFGFERANITHKDNSISNGVFKRYPLIIERNKLDEGSTSYTVSRAVPSIIGEYNFICYVNYAHQLQNLYFALTGEELTINQ